MGTDANERVIAELQVNSDKNLMIRNLFASSHIFTETSNKGDTPREMAERMPRVIHINILGYNIRKGSRNLIEPFKVMYTNEPKEVAIAKFGGYNVQLPKVFEMERDFRSGLYCWCYALYTAHIEGRTMQEVVTMEPALQEYAKQDEGFQQFCDRYNFVSEDAKARREYVLWINDRMREAGMWASAWDEGMEEGFEKGREEGIEIGIEKGIEKGREEGIEIGIENVALNMLKINLPNETIAEVTGLPLEKVEALREKQPRR